jgi:acetyl-CoA C-acetyltransferase
MWLETHLICGAGEGWKMVDSGATEIGGDFPVDMSGGVLCSNPIGASGMIRCLEAANQVRGTAGDYQVEGARVALGQAYGGPSSYFAMWIVSSDPSPNFG